MCVRVRVCGGVWGDVRVYACVRIGVYVCLCVCVCARVRVYVRLCV